MVYQLDIPKCIYQLVGQRKKYDIYISKSTIKDFKKVQNVLWSIKNRVGASSRLYSSSNFEKKAMLSTKNLIKPSRVTLSMLTFITPNVCPKWSNSSRSTTKMAKQSFGPIWHRAIVQRKRYKIVPKAETVQCRALLALLARAMYAKGLLNFAVESKGS
jgi:hypothetical protein